MNSAYLVVHPSRHHRGRVCDIASLIFASDLQVTLGILALLRHLASFVLCNLQILKTAAQTDPVSGHHFIKAGDCTNPLSLIIR